MWLNPQETADLVTFTEEILNGKLHFCAMFPNLSLSQNYLKLILNINLGNCWLLLKGKSARGGETVQYINLKVSSF